MWTRTGRQQLLGDSFSLCKAGRGEDGSPAVLVYHHGSTGVDVGPVQNGLTKLLHIPRSDRLGVGQLGGKHLHEHGRDTESVSFWIKLGARVINVDIVYISPSSRMFGTLSLKRNN